MMKEFTDMLASFGQQSTTGLSAYFYDNAAQIDHLIQLYNTFNQQTTDLQTNRILALKKSMRLLTQDQHWSDQEGLELRYNHPNIVLEASFESTKSNPLGKFVIRITTPTIQAWNLYESRLINDYAGTEPQIAGNKTILEVGTIWENDAEQIQAALQQVYTYLLQLVSKRVVV